MSTPSSLAETVLAQAQAAHAAPATTDSAAATDSGTDSGTASDSGTDSGTDSSDEAAPAGLSWEAALKRVPPDVAKLMKSMQADYTRKTQEVASQRKELLREREALSKGLAQVKAPAELPAYDPFDEQTIKARIEAEVVRRLQESMAPLMAEHEMLQAEEEYQTFLRTAPDFESDEVLRGEVQRALEANPSLDLETAYWAAKGRRSQQQRADEAKAAKARRDAEREAAQRGTALPRRGATPARPVASEVKRMSTEDILRLAQRLNGL